ncbi:MAG TPA: TonB-dependent receptor [Vicinamibacteria bacterium]|nr:TonB-dependent receptor [Vicinamibacteria bacterium]
MRLRRRRRMVVWISGLGFALAALTEGGVEPPAGAHLRGLVLDSTGASIVSASLILRQAGTPGEIVSTSDGEGRYQFSNVAPGSHVLEVVAPGFSLAQKTLALAPGENLSLDVTLEPGTFTETVTVIASHLGGRPETLERIPGSIEVIEPELLTRSHPFNFSEALRKATGVNVRDEEGFGLRPNIGLRGLNPTRSTKVLLLEDGLFVTYAPYGDNASYYHPPIERFESIEVMKGSSQIAYGPVTVGGVINYLTPAPPLEPSGYAMVTAGNRDFLDAKVAYGGTWGTTGLLVDWTRKQGDGARDNVHSELNDVTLKLVQTLGPRQTLTLKGNYYGEESNVTYSGLRQSEFEQDPRQNPFANDFFYGDRFGASAAHSFLVRDDALLTTQLYGMAFSRDWWRQSSNSGQRPNDAADPSCGGMTSLNTSCGNEGRLRDYRHFGVDSRLRFSHSLLGVRSEAEVGGRLHFEEQDRLQRNGDRPTSRDGVTVEDNERKNDAYSLFVQNRALLGDWTITPGVRVEGVGYERTNRLANGGAGVNGTANLVQWVPGIGASYRIGARGSVFGGVHRGWAPPRTEDIISNTTGGVVELDPELSWNYELGIRSEPSPGLRVDATWFRMDYENQVVPASVSGGQGATLTNTGETLQQGFELGARLDLDEAFSTPLDLFARVAYTFLPTAKFEGERFSNIPGSTAVSVEGNRLPYAPENLLNASFGYTHSSGLDLFLEVVLVGEQFGDDLNSIDPSADGQRGLLPGHTIWNATASYPWDEIHSTVFVTVKNLTDRLYIADRVRGIVPGAPQLVQVGVRFGL